MTNVLIIDNYDSFTFNLVQYLGELGANPVVFRNDRISLTEVAELDPSHILISPGPGRPEDAGITLELISRFASERTPILGVCLGHQAVAMAFGASIKRSTVPVHGKTSSVSHYGGNLYAGIPSPFTATRYHSLEVDPALPGCLKVTARTADGTIMGIRHTRLALEGVQFHPESILTQYGKQILENFLSHRNPHEEGPERA